MPHETKREEEVEEEEGEKGRRVAADNAAGYLEAPVRSSRMFRKRVRIVAML